MSLYADPVGNLKELISFESISHAPILNLCEWVATACSSFGFHCEIQRDPVHSSKANVVATLGPQIPGGIILSGHLDVVPTEDQPWTTDPFVLTEIDDRLYGRGTSDMKGFVAATLSALAQMDLSRLKRPVVLIWTYDEEIGCKGSAQFAKLHKELPDWYPREALIGEPTDLKIFRMHPGHVSFKIDITGQAAHSSKPDLGKSAISAAVPILSLLEELEIDLKRERRLEAFLERPFVTLNVGIIRGGQAINIVPDHCEIHVGYRPLPGDDPKAVFFRFQERLQDFSKSDVSRVKIELQNITPALLSEDGLALEALLLPHALSPKTGAAAFATDGGNFASIGIQSLIFGPGSIDVAHRANEFIEKSALLAAPAIIRDIIRKRCD